ncbi:MAG: NlpC/P60 family protein [Nakamurella sp.]
MVKKPKKPNDAGKLALDAAKKAVILKIAVVLAPWVAGLLLIVVGIPVAMGVLFGGTGGIVGQATAHSAQGCPGSSPANQKVGYNTTKPAPSTPAPIATAIPPVLPPAGAIGPAAPPATETPMPYPLPAAHGFTGSEEAVNDAGQVASTGGAVTWASFASLGQPYRDYYITMRWNYGAWNWDGTATDIDQAQYNWMAGGNDGKPWLVLVTNPRTHSSIIAAAIEAGPGPWVGVVSSTQRSIENGPANGWLNPTRGTPDGYKGIVSGFPPVAMKALGDASGPAHTGYPGQTGDDLTYQWAPDQTATPGPTGATATRVSTSVGACSNVTNGTSCNVTGTYSGLSEAQQANARAVANVALARGLGVDGVVLGIMTAYTESTLNNVTHGDAMGPSSRGLFQQMPGWGPEAVRMDPAGAAGLFFDRVVGIGGWAAQQPWAVAQAVQESEFVDGSNYQGNYSVALDIATALLDGPAGIAATGTPAPTGAAVDVAAQWCTAETGGGGVVVNGVKVTIPDRPDVPSEIRGKTIDAPSSAVATGIAAGFATIGMPYVWGGGTDGGGPDQGCARAGSDLNACQGIVGLDCSGLTGYVLAQAGFSIPGNSGGQRGSGVGIPQSAAIAGDIIGYEGHVAIFLGSVDGIQYMLEAPDVGSNIHIRTARWSGADSDVHRYWGATA